MNRTTLLRMATLVLGTASLVAVPATDVAMAAGPATDCTISVTEAVVNQSVAPTTTSITIDTANSIPGFNDFYFWFTDGTYESVISLMQTGSLTFTQSHGQLLASMSAIALTDVPIEGSILAGGSTNINLFQCQAQVVLTPNAPPSAPSDVVATAGDGEATVSWTPWKTFDGQTFEVTASPGGQTCTATYPELSCTVTGLTNGTAYSFSVTTETTGGTSPASSPSTEVTPEATDEPEVTTPEDTTPEPTTPEDTTPEPTTPEDTTPSDTTPDNTGNPVDEADGSGTPENELLPPTGSNDAVLMTLVVVLLAVGTSMLRLSRRHDA